MAQNMTERTAPTFADRFGRVAANGLAATAALASAFLPMAGTAQTFQNVNVAPIHTFAVGQCVTGDQLRAAGQNPVLAAEKMVTVATNRPIMIYTANASGAIGYEMGADRPVRMQNNGQFSEPQRPACYLISGQLREVRLNDVATGRVRRDFYQPIANSSLNNSIDAGLRSGALPMLQATALLRDGRAGPLVTVFVGSNGQSGTVMNAGAQGATSITDTLRAPVYTQYSASYFPRGTQVAAPSPSGN